jgi:hypothetical protein
MQITFKNGKLIVTHPTGVTSEYARADLDKFKANIESIIKKLNERKTEIEQEQAQIDAAASN